MQPFSQLHSHFLSNQNPKFKTQNSKSKTQNLESTQIDILFFTLTSDATILSTIFQLFKTQNLD